MCQFVYQSNQKKQSAREKCWQDEQLVPLPLQDAPCHGNAATSGANEVENMETLVGQLRAENQLLRRQLRWHEECRDWVSSTAVWGMCHSEWPEWIILEGRSIQQHQDEVKKVRSSLGRTEATAKPVPEDAFSIMGAPSTPVKHRFQCILQK